MKKLFCLAFSFLFFSTVTHAQSDTSQFVFPKRIYVGDTAELHYTFNSGVDFFPDEENVDEKPLILSALPFSVDSEDFTLQKACIQRNGTLYTVVLTFIPWKVGVIDFPQFDLYAAVFGASSVAFVIDPEIVEVSSIISGEDVVLRPFASPLLFPGTIYFVYGVIILFLVILILAVHSTIKWKELSAKLKERKTLRKYAKSARYAMRQLRKLEKRSLKIGDGVFCAGIQKIFRTYLTVRLGIDFNVLATNQFVEAFHLATGGILDGFLVDNMEAIVEIFIRMDYVRFARNSVESKRMPAEKFATELNDGERMEIIETSRAIIKLFERGK